MAITFYYKIKLITIMVKSIRFFEEGPRPFSFKKTILFRIASWTRLKIMLTFCGRQAICLSIFLIGYSRCYDELISILFQGPF